MWGPGTGMSMCTSCKALWGKFVICDIGLHKNKLKIVHWPLFEVSVLTTTHVAKSATPHRGQLKLKPLTSGWHPPWVSSHCKHARLPVAAASCAGLAPLFARQLPASPASSTRKRRQVSLPARAAWWTGEAPSPSLMSPVSAFCANCNFRVCTSPRLAASSASSSSTTIAASAVRTTPSSGCLLLSPISSPR